MKSSIEGRRTLRRAVVTAVAVAGMGVAAAPAVAQETPPPPTPTAPDNTYTCRGTPLKTGNLIVLSQGLNVASANNREKPCATDYQKVLNLKVPLAGGLNPLAQLLGVNTGTLLQVNLLEGFTAFEPNDNGAGATSRTAYVRLNVLGLVIEVGALESHARARVEDDCTTSQYGFSNIAQMKINGKPVFSGHQPGTIPLGPLGAIYLNQTVRGENDLTQRAVFIDLPGTSLDVTIGESKAGAACSAL